MTTEPNKPNTTLTTPNEDGLSLIAAHYDQVGAYARSVDAAVSSGTVALGRKGLETPAVVHASVVEIPPCDSKPILLRWNELKAGDYWALCVDEIIEEDPHLVRVCLNESGKLTIKLDGIEHALSDNWDFYQYLPCVRPSRSQVKFQTDI